MLSLASRSSMPRLLAPARRGGRSDELARRRLQKAASQESPAELPGRPTPPGARASSADKAAMMMMMMMMT